MVKGWADRMTRPPATLASTSAAARVTPREATDSRATREVMSMPRLLMTMMAAMTYSTSLMPEARYFCTRSSSLGRERSFRVSFSTARMTTRQRSSVTMAASTSPRATLPMDWFKMEVKSDITGKSSFQETKCKEIIPETGEKVNVSGKSGCGPERQLI